MRGRPWQELAANLARCRVLIVPSGNPDGRARCPFDSWVGADLATNERVGMGTRPDGSSYRWPDVKRVHPMRGAAVGTLGAYFNDDGVNLMHDDWFDPMAAETRAFLKLAREEAPDYLVSLHSHASHPSIEPTAYVPRTVKETIRAIGDRVQRRYADAGLPHRAGGPAPAEDGTDFPPPSSTWPAPCTTPAAAWRSSTSARSASATPPTRRRPTTRSSTCNCCSSTSCSASRSSTPSGGHDEARTDRPITWRESR